MFATSLDILHWVLAAAIAVLTFFLCWSLYYFIASARSFYRVIGKVESGVDKASELVDLAKDKIKNSATYLMMIGEFAKQAIGFIQQKRQQSADRKKKK